MAARAFQPVTLDTDTEIINEVFLADPHGLTVAGHQFLISDPVPVRGPHNLLSGFRVAGQTGIGDIRAAFKLLDFIQIRVIGLGRLFRHKVPGLVLVRPLVTGDRVNRQAHDGKYGYGYQQEGNTPNHQHKPPFLDGGFFMFTVIMITHT